LAVCLAKPLAVQAAAVPDWLAAANRLDLGHFGDGSAAVIVGQWRDFSVDATGKFTLTERCAIRVLNRKSAERYLDAVGWENNATKVTSIQTWAINSAGHVTQSGKNDLITQAGFAEYEMFSDDRVKMIKAPGAEDGSLVGYEVVTQGRIPINGESFSLEQEIPIRLGELRLSVPSGSMQPTLLIGDYIMVNKFVYAPVLDGVPLIGRLERALFPIREVRRGDIVVFKFPEEPEKDYIKRVIGLPGETIEIRARQVYIDGQPLPEPYKVHRNPRGLNWEQDDYPPTKVPERSLFCMGDNRDNSRDSRSWGFVPREYLKGRAFMIWWSYDEDRDAYLKTSALDRIKAIFSKLGHFLTKSRWERTFHIIR